MYLAAECYRYKVTRDPEARKFAQDTFQGLKILYKVVPDKNKGFMAKAVMLKDKLPSPQWFYSDQPGYN